MVELRIFELCPGGETKDITFVYNASFFLYATLETARPMAHGRVQTPAATETPAFTGVPVSGMAYLDRPAEAGYFLFPDLSVRHEGRYKLLFNLYEELKEEADLDVGNNEPDNPFYNNKWFNWRMQIRTVDFSVYSAKKFPGLSESTTLSRTVAEQGCRVRIRRDVRMRRRDGKPAGGDFKKVEDNYGHTPTAPTPEHQPHHDYRQRSASAASDHSRIAESHRRQSMAEYPAPPPPPGYSQGAGSHHLGFGHGVPHAPQAYVPPPPPPMSPAPGYPSSAASPYQTPQMPAYGYGSRPQSQYGPAKGGFDERRYSNASYTAPSPQYLSGVMPNGEPKTEVVDPRGERSLSQSYPSAPHGMLPAPRTDDSRNVTLPPMSEILKPNTMREVMHNPPVTNLGKIEPDLNPSPTEAPHAAVPTGSKRRFEEPAYQQSLYNGARPRDADEDHRYLRYPGLACHDANGRLRSYTENIYDRR